jgi:hypothetical protein
MPLQQIQRGEIWLRSDLKCLKTHAEKILRKSISGVQIFPMLYGTARYPQFYLRRAA